MVTGYEFGSEFGGEEPLLTEKVHQMLRYAELPWLRAAEMLMTLAL